MITLLICESMLTSVAFGRKHILLGFDSLVLNGLDTPSGCFDPYTLRITRLSARGVAAGLLPHRQTYRDRRLGGVGQVTLTSTGLETCAATQVLVGSAAPT